MEIISRSSTGSRPTCYPSLTGITNAGTANLFAKLMSWLVFLYPLILHSLCKIFCYTSYLTHPRHWSDGYYSSDFLNVKSSISWNKDSSYLNVLYICLDHRFAIAVPPHYIQKPFCSNLNVFVHVHNYVHLFITSVPIDAFVSSLAFLASFMISHICLKIPSQLVILTYVINQMILSESLQDYFQVETPIITTIGKADHG